MKLQHIRTLVISFLSLAILLLGFIGSYNNYVENIKNQHEELIEKVNTIKRFIKVNEVTSLDGSSIDTLNQNYHSLQHKMTALNNSMPDIRYIYLLGMRDSLLFFYVDSQADNRSNNVLSELASPGDVYKDAPIEFYKAYYQQQELICGPYEDKWGNFISVVTPVRDNNKKIVALIGADVLYTDFISVFQVKTMTPILFSIILIFVFLIIYLLYGHKLIEDNKLLNTLHKIKFALSQSLDALLIINDENKIIFINSAASLLTSTAFEINLKEGDNFKTLFVDKVSRDLSLKISQIFKHGIKSGDVLKFNIPINNKNISFKFSPVFSENNHIEQLLIHLNKMDYSVSDKEIVDDFDEEKLILEHINEVVWQLNFEGVIITASTSAKQMLGYNKDDLIFKNITDFLDLKSSIKIKNTLQNLFGACQNNLKMEEVLLVLQFLKSTKEIVDVEVRIIPKKNIIGEPIGLVMVMRKVNENIDAIIELYETKKAIQTYFNHIPGIIYRCAIDKNWTMKFMTNGCYDLTGYQVDDFIENKKIAFNDIILVEYRELIWSKWQKVIEKRGLFESQYQIETATGMVKWVFEKGRCVYDENDVPVALEGFIIDISDRVKSEEIIKLNEQRFRDYLESSYLPNFVTDSKGNIRDFNLALSKFVAIEKLSLYNKSIFNIIDDEYTNRVRLLLDHLKTERNVEMVVKIKIGEKSLFTTLFASKVYDDEYIFYIINNHDLITKNNYLSTDVELLKSSLSNLSFPVFLIDVKTRTIIAQSIDTINLDKDAACPCFRLLKDTEMTCDIFNANCIVNQMIEAGNSITGNYSIKTQNGNKHFVVDVRPVFTTQSKEDISHALIVLTDVTEITILEEKLSIMRKSLDNMFSYHFTNQNELLTLIKEQLNKENNALDNELSDFLINEINNSRLLSLLFAHDYVFDLDAFSPQDEAKLLLEKIKSQQGIFENKHLYFFDQFINDTSVLVSKKIYDILFYLSIHYSFKHAYEGKLKFKQGCNDHNFLFFEIELIVDEPCFSEIQNFSEIDFFALFLNLKENHPAVIDFAFINKVCTILNIKLLLEKQKANTLSFKYIFQKCVVEDIKKSESTEKDDFSIVIVDSDKEFLSYLSNVLLQEYSKVISFKDYFEVIKYFDDVNIEEKPDLLIINNLVNKIPAVDILKKINPQKLPNYDKLIFLKSSFQHEDKPEKALSDINNCFEYPFLKSEFLNYVRKVMLNEETKK